MVKELINNLLGKGNENDIPDELPSLADSAPPSKKTPIPNELPEIKVSKPLPKSDSKPEQKPELKLPEIKTDSKPQVESKPVVQTVVVSPPIIISKPVVQSYEKPSETPKVKSDIEKEIELLQKEFKESTDPKTGELKKIDSSNDALALINSQPLQKTTVQQDSIAPSLDTTKPQSSEMQFAMPSMAVKLQDQEQKPGFFSDFYKILKEQGFNESLLSQDLFSRMKNYHDIIPSETQSVFSGDEPQLKDKLLQKIDELKDLESKWQVQKAILEEDKKFLLQREEEVKKKILELKGISKELKFHQNVPSTMFFTLRNGVVLKNVIEMITILKVLDDNTFLFHVNEQKNDFYNWIKHAVNDLPLAQKIQYLKDRGQIIIALESEIKNEEEHPESVSLFDTLYNQRKTSVAITTKNSTLPTFPNTPIYVPTNNSPIYNGQNTSLNEQKSLNFNFNQSNLPPNSPSQLSTNLPQQSVKLAPSYNSPTNPELFFRLKNGKQVQNLPDLTKELKEISDDEFFHHVNNQKNDFAQWVRYVFKDEKLAAYLEPIKNRQEMIKFLEVFL